MDPGRSAPPRLDGPSLPLGARARSGPGSATGRPWQTFMMVLGSILLALLALTGVLVLFSPGLPAPLADRAGRPIPGSLSEKVFIEINGVRQGMLIQSADPSNPVLLFLHGGPGMPEFFLNTTHPTGLERHFTVVWWEQRGAGMSYSRGIPPETMTVEQLIADAIEVATYLQNRFDQDRIILLGHSWGSFLGIQVAARAPELFHAYVGMGQVSHQLRSEVAARGAMIDAYRDRGDGSMVRKLEAAPADMAGGLSEAYLRLRDPAMHRLGGGTTRDMRSVITGVFLPVWFNRAYTLREKANIWRGLAWSRQFLWEDFLRTDLAERVKHLDIPVYFFMGRHDLTVDRALAEHFFLTLQAPEKGFYTFENSAHSPLFEEPARALGILLEEVVGR